MDRRWIVLALIALLVLAGVVLFALRPPAAGKLAQGEKPFLLPIEPVGIVESPPEEIRWRPVLGAVRYEVELFDGEGSPLWRGESGKGVLALPPEISERVLRGDRLHYRVAAKGNFGKTLVSSEITFFRYLAKRG